MPYITCFQSEIQKQISFDDILSGECDISKYIVGDPTNTVVRFVEYPKERFLKKYNVTDMILALGDFNYRHKDLFKCERHSLYREFTIPKKTGGRRKICAPVEPLMEALRELKGLFERFLPAHYHTSAFAYIKGRSVMKANMRHQSNGSKWFAKFDFHDFFGSTNIDFTMKMFSMIFPFSEIVKSQRGRDALLTALDLCFLNGGLPQGTPISPLITNIVMIPIDAKLYNMLRDYTYLTSDHKEIRRYYVYTRYADDMDISSRHWFDFRKIIELIHCVLHEFGAPFSLNESKTRYGSSSGSNWNLGLMLNKDNNITVGYRNKRVMKAAVTNYVTTHLNGFNPKLREVQKLQGLISYHRSVDKGYTDYAVDRIGSKFGVSVDRMIKEDINALAS